jgi:hypothetical protein
MKKNCLAKKIKMKHRSPKALLMIIRYGELDIIQIFICSDMNNFLWQEWLKPKKRPLMEESDEDDEEEIPDDNFEQQMSGEEEDEEDDDGKRN